MDLIFKRYSSPFELLDNIISSSHLCEFLEKLAKKVQDERLYELWLHKVFNKTYPEWKKEVITNMKRVNEYKNLTEEDKETILEDSYSILKNFISDS